MLAVTPVALGNPSFEQLAGPDNEPIRVAVWSVDGETGNAFNPDSTAYPNASDNTPAGGVLPAPGDGKQVLFINSFGSASQTLTNALAQPGIIAIIEELGNLERLQEAEDELAARRTRSAHTAGGPSDGSAGAAIVGPPADVRPALDPGLLPTTPKPKRD